MTEISEDTFIILSLDITGCFVSDLFLDDVYSAEISQTIRGVINKLLVSKAISYATLRSDLGCVIPAISEALGEEYLSKLAVWDSRAHPVHEEFSRLWIWHLLFIMLVQEWDEKGAGDKNLTLMRPESLSYRMAVRSYISHINNVRTEYDIVENSLKSEWDDFIAKACREYREPLLEIINSLHSKRLWDYLQTELNNEDMEELSAWGLAEAERRGMPSFYDIPPVKMQISTTDEHR